MKERRPLSYGALAGLLAVLAVCEAMGQAEPASRSGEGPSREPPALRLVQTIPLPAVEGRIDHLGVDVKGQRLFVAALGNNTVEVLDLRAGKRARSIKGLREAQGVFFVPELDKIFVANARGGAVNIFDGESFEPVGEVNYSDDADNVRYDPRAKRIYVGYGDGALGIIDAASGKRLGDIKLAAHPESFQLETAGPRIFVNVPDAGHVAVIDRNGQAVVAQWHIEGAAADFPMALDEPDHRLFITCRRPPQMAVFDTASGKMVARLAVVGDADDMFYDATRKRIYISGGEGAISVVERRDADRYKLVETAPTAPGARTSLFVPALNRLYLAVPHRGSQKAEIRVYELM